MFQAIQFVVYTLTMLFSQVILFIGIISLTEAHTLWTKRDGNCSSLPLGKGPVPSPDTSQEFLKSETLASSANNSPTPANYTLSFKNLQASSTADGYLGYIPMDSYDTELCAANCTAKKQCQSINIFFERDPIVAVGPDCVNPPSTTTIKCTFWGSAVTEANSKNEGYTDNAFVVAIAGSNGYYNERAGNVDTGYSVKSFSIPSSAVLLIPVLSTILGEVISRR